MTNAEYQQRRDAILDNMGYTKNIDSRREAKQAIDNLFLELLDVDENDPDRNVRWQAYRNQLRQELRNVIKDTDDDLQNN